MRLLRGDGGRPHTLHGTCAAPCANQAARRLQLRNPSCYPQALALPAPWRETKGGASFPETARSQVMGQPEHRPPGNGLGRCLPSSPTGRGRAGLAGSSFLSRRGPSREVTAEQVSEAQGQGQEAVAGRRHREGALHPAGLRQLRS